QVGALQQGPEIIRNNSFHGDEFNYHQNLLRGINNQRDLIQPQHYNYHNENSVSINQMESYYQGGDSDAQSVDKGYHSNRAPERIAGHNDLHNNSHNRSSITPWSDDDQSSAFMALPMERTDYSDSGHKSRDDDGDEYHGIENEVSQGYTYENLPVHIQPQQSYVASKYTEDVRGSSEDQFRETDTSYDQLRLLYESRGQQIDKLSDELEKLKGSTSKEIRILRHKKNVLENEKGGFEASISQLKQLLLDKEARISTLTTDLKELKLKLSNLEDENKRICGKLETAESTISSLEYQVSELQATDSLAKSRKMQEDFLNKVRQNHQEETRDLITKLKEMQVKLETTQQESQKQQRELKNAREQNDQIIRQKSEMIAQLSASLETSQKQCSELLQSNNGQKNLALQVNIQILEATKESLENKLCTLEEELKKSKDEQAIFDKELKLYLTAPGKILPENDNSIDQLGLKKVLCYDDEAEKSESEKKKTKTINEDDGIEELKSNMMLCLEINKKRRADIEELTKDLHNKQIQIKKLQSEFKSAQIKIQELKDQNSTSKRLSHEMHHAEMSSRSEKQDIEAEHEAIRNENASLKEELVQLTQIVEGVHASATAMENIIKDLNNNLGKSDSSSQIHNFLQVTEAFSKAVNGLQVHYDEVNTKLRKQNSLLHKSQNLWGRKIEELIQRVKSSEKSLKYIANGNRGRTSDVSFIQNGHQKILEDMYQYSKNLKSAVEPVNKENNVLRDEIWTVRLEMERMKKKEKNILDEINSLQAQMQYNKKDKEAALESCRNSYLKFHEDSVHDIKAQMMKDHEIIVYELKDQLRKLHNELTNSKTEYLELCEEKKQLEIELEQIKCHNNDNREYNNSNKTFPKSFDEQSSTESLRTETQELAEKWKLFNENYEELRGQKQAVDVECAKLKQEFESIKAIKQAVDVECTQFKQELENIKAIKQSVDVECTKLKQELENIKVIKQHEYDLLENKYRDIKDSECSKCRELESECDRIAQQLKRAEENIHELEKQKQVILENQFSHNDSTIRIEKHQLEHNILNEKYQVLLEEKTKLQEKYDQEHKEFVRRSDKYNKEIIEKENNIESLMIKYSDLKKLNEQELSNLKENNSSLKDEVYQIKKERDQDVDELTEKLLSLESDLKEKELHIQSIKEEVSKKRSEVVDKQSNYSHEIKKLQTQIEKLKVDINDSQTTNKQVTTKYNNLKLKYKSYGESKDEEVAHYKIEVSKVKKDFREGFAINLEKFQSFLEKLKDIVLNELKRLEDELRKNGCNIDIKGVIDMLVQLQKLLTNTEYNPKSRGSHNHQE
ncbi:unnamed protein product, partial [Meganyctiphanes norvegica]